MNKKADINLDIDKGDTLLGGRFKNSPTVVKDIGTDELGQPTVNGKKLLAMRIKKLMPTQEVAKEAGVDSAPNYTPASDPAAKCSKCVHAKDGYCTLYDFDFDPEYTCDSFSTDFNATTTTGVPQVLEKYLPKVAQHKNLNILYGVLNHMKEAQAQQPQGLQHQTTKPTGGPKPPPMTGNNLNSSFKNIAQQGVRNGAATAAGVKPKTNNNMSIPYGVNSGGMPYGVNAMSPEMLQAPQKSAQYQPQGYGYPQQQQSDYGMQQYQARLQNTRAAIQNAAAQRYQQMQDQAQQQAYQQAVAAQQGQAQLQSYDGGKQAEYLAGFFDKCASYGVDPVLMNNLRHELLKEASYTPKQKNKVSKVMKEFKDGTLRSGNADGPKVTSRQQAIAIALSEAGVNKKS